jgi:phosphomannomutase
MSFEIPADLMVSVSGVRGRVGAGLTPEIVARFAAAFGAWLHESAERPRVVLARDSRVTGPMLVQAVRAGLQSVGCDVIEAGLVPTPTALFTIGHHGADGGIVVTASHNPVEWNALKFASRAGMFLDADESPAMRAYVSDRPITRATWDRLGTITQDEQAADRHLEAVLRIPYLDLEGLRARRFRVALDCTRGAGGVLLPRLLERLGCEVIGMDLEPDGRFTRTPEPVAENLAGLEVAVRESGADVGMATDPDADRLSLVSNEGRAVGEDLTLAIAAQLVLRHNSGPVVTNLSTSRVLEDVASEAGVELHRAPVGEINVARAMQQVRAVIGGEGNGGVILPDVQHTRDAAVAIALILQAMLESVMAFGDMVRQFRSYTIVKDKVPAGGAPLAAAYSMLEEWPFSHGIPRIDRRDGLRLEWPEAGMWLHLRPSGTEPIYRIIAEAPASEGARELVAQARAALSRAG